MADVDRETRIKQAYAGVTRILSGRASATIEAQLHELTASGYDLDQPPDMYGGGIVEELERRVADLLGKPAAAFFPTGTMAQQVALRIWSEKAGNPTVALHPLHHPEMYEKHAYATLTGLRSVWPTTARRAATGDEIRGLAEPFAAIQIELPLREAGFLLPTWDELRTCVPRHASAERSSISTAPAFGSRRPISARTSRPSPRSRTASTCRSTSHWAACPVRRSSATKTFIATAKAWRHRYGGQLFTQWPAVLSALSGLDQQLPRLPEYVAHAKVVAAALATLPGLTVYPNPPHTQQFQLWLAHPVATANEAVLTLAEDLKVRFVDGWRPQAPGDRCMAEVSIGASALEWSADDVIEIGTEFLARM